MFVKLLFVYAMLEGRYAEVSGESIIKGVFPSDIQKELLDAYKKTGALKVAVRSSSPFEDTSRGSAAGQFDTLLNIAETG